MSKRIILTGGGTGGHITPLLAVAHEIKLQDPKSYVIYIGERNGKFTHLTENNSDIDETHFIFAGKFRRYHKESWLRRLFAVKTNLLNIRDGLFFVIGTIQSLALLRRLRPDILLLKGGFVGVPIGIAAALLKKPFITHDSDAIPGLANRLVSKWALYHATGMPPEYYRYPEASVRYVGVLVGDMYEYVTKNHKDDYRKQIGITTDSQVLLITGGSHGAVVINQSIRAIISQLLELFPDLNVIHQVGKGNKKIYQDYSNERLQVHELLQPMYVYTGSADVVITRAGGNTMAELGHQGKACVVIPNPLLTGGHQLKNAALWREKQAAIVLDEETIKKDPAQLMEQIVALLSDENKRTTLGANLEALTAKNAASKLVKLLLDS